MDRIFYTAKAITDHLTKLLPNEGGDVEAWVEGEFCHFKEMGRKLPESIKATSLSKWITRYKRRGRHGVSFDRGRVLYCNKSIQ